MSIALGSTATTTRKIGSTPITKRYLGATLVWSAGYTPPSGCAIWLDASDTGTVWDATSGGSHCTNGGALKRIDDKSGNGRHFTEGTSYPTWAASAINGLGAVAMANQKGLIRTGGTFAETDFDNVFLVSQTSDGQYVLLGTAAPAYFLDATLAGNASNCYSGLTPGQFRVNYANVVATRTALAAARGTSANLLASMGMSAQNAAFASPKIGYTTSASDYNVSSGYFCELLVFAGTMATASRDSVESYLTAKWL